MEQENMDGNEPLIEGLLKLPPGGFPSPQPREGLREAILGRTGAVVRGRRRRRRLGIFLGALLLYSAGMATAFLLHRVPGEPPHPLPSSTGGALALVPSSLGPEELLGQVPQASREERLRLLRRAGDSYLFDRGNLERALHCYQQLLELSPPELKRVPQSEDSWFLLTLKQGRVFQERGET